MDSDILSWISFIITCIGTFAAIISKDFRDFIKNSLSKISDSSSELLDKAKKLRLKDYVIISFIIFYLISIIIFVFYTGATWADNAPLSEEKYNLDLKQIVTSLNLLTVSYLIIIFPFERLKYGIEIEPNFKNDILKKIINSFEKSNNSKKSNPENIIKDGNLQLEISAKGKIDKKAQTKLRGILIVWLSILIFWSIFYSLMALIDLFHLPLNSYRVSFIVRSWNAVDTIQFLILYNLLIKVQSEASLKYSYNQSRYFFWTLAILICIDITMLFFIHSPALSFLLTMIGAILSGLAFLLMFSALQNIFFQISRYKIYIFILYGIFQCIYPLIIVGNDVPLPFDESRYSPATAEALAELSDNVLLEIRESSLSWRKNIASFAGFLLLIGGIIAAWAKLILGRLFRNKSFQRQLIFYDMGNAIIAPPIHRHFEIRNEDYFKPNQIKKD